MRAVNHFPESGKRRRDIPERRFLFLWRVFRLWRYPPHIRRRKRVYRLSMGFLAVWDEIYSTPPPDENHSLESGERFRNAASLACDAADTGRSMGFLEVPPPTLSRFLHRVEADSVSVKNSRQSSMS